MKNGRAMKLNFQERRFLEAYRRFYQEQYPAKAEDNQNAHVQGQKAIYLLMVKDVRVGNYGFTWQDFGPCSDELQDIMRSLDQKPQAVEKFYASYPVCEETTQKLYSNETNGTRLFWKKDADKIDNIRSILLDAPCSTVPDGSSDTPLRRWMELLGSLTYIARTRLPGAGANRVWEELMKAESKEKYRTPMRGEKNSSLKTLTKAALLPDDAF